MVHLVCFGRKESLGFPKLHGMCFAFIQLYVVHTCLTLLTLLPKVGTSVQPYVWAFRGIVTLRYLLAVSGRALRWAVSSPH